LDVRRRQVLSIIITTTESRVHMAHATTADLRNGPNGWDCVHRGGGGGGGGDGAYAGAAEVKRPDTGTLWPFAYMHCTNA